MSIRRRSVGTALLAAMALTACSGQGDVAQISPDASPSVSPEASASPSVTVSPEPEALAWGPTLEDWDDALATAEALTVRQAAGAVLLPAYSAADAEGVHALVSDSGVAGVMLMGEATGSATTASTLAASAQDGAGDRGWPAVVAVDQEGGPVARLGDAVAQLPAFMAAGAVPDEAVIRETYAQAGAELKALGFTVDFAPVGDVTVGLADPVIRTRSAGDDPERVAATVVSASLGYLEGGVAPTVKHFPGHGAVTTDSHASVPTRDASLAEIESVDLVPFREAVEAGVPLVMMSHVAVPEWGGVPASVDPQAYVALRDGLGFTGVAVTDALNMGAITEGLAPGEAAVQALRAGADLLLMPESMVKARSAIVQAVESGSLSRERLDEAAARVILLARWQESLTSSVTVADGYAEDFAREAVTVGATACDAPFLGQRVTITGGFAADRDALAAALEAHGVQVGGGGTSIWITGSDDSSGSADVVVAMGGPWALERSNASVYVAAYGRSPEALAGVAAVLAGDAEPRGEWPISLDGVPAAC